MGSLLLLFVIRDSSPVVTVNFQDGSFQAFKGRQVFFAVVEFFADPWSNSILDDLP